nr:hypothetical protein [uncultured Anaerotignum sp.]
MTEQERRRRRREMERQMRQKGREKKSGTFGFRTYVTAVLVGGCLLISLFESKTSDMVCEKMKETIAYQISTEELEKWKSRGAAFWKEAEESLPVFRERQPERMYRPDTKESP